MTTDPKRVKEIFLEAAELPDEAARAAYLDRACGGDAGLRARVEALLRAHDPADSFLGTPAAVVPDPDRCHPGACRQLRPRRGGRTDARRRRRSDDEAADVPGPVHPPRFARPARALRGARRCSARAASASSSGRSTRCSSAWSRSRSGPAAGRHLAGPQAVPARGPVVGRRSATRTWCRCTRSPSSRCPTW